MKVRVKENIGEKSERFFGEVGTTWDFSKMAYALKLAFPMSDATITTLEDLNSYIELDIPKKFYTIFEEVKISADHLTAKEENSSCLEDELIFLEKSLKKAVAKVMAEFENE